MEAQKRMCTVRYLAFPVQENAIRGAEGRQLGETVVGHLDRLGTKESKRQRTACMTLSVPKLEGKCCQSSQIPDRSQEVKGSSYRKI